MKKYYIFKMNTGFISILSIILFIIALLITFILDKKLLIESFLIRDFPIFIIEMILFTIMHEILHSVGYVIYGANYKNIYYGASLEKGILYCLCKQRITKKNILASLMIPFIIIGLITYIISIIYKFPRLLILSIINISGCAGDLLMFNFIKKLKNIQFSEFDREDEFAIYSDKDIKETIGLKFIEKMAKLEIKNKNKITISKGSIIVFAILLVMCLLIRRFNI